MSDASVASALRSDKQLVIVEAPAGCGKTHQAAEYASWLASTYVDRSQVLILTHTHAACDVFRNRTRAVRQRIHITTIDGLIAQVASIYRVALDLPTDVTAWVSEQQDGFQLLAAKVDMLLARSKAVTGALVVRYPIVLCDEHQDANDAQHRVVMRLFEAGAKLRVFGDPMQAIYTKGKRERIAHAQRWRELCERADIVEELDRPHRWTSGSLELGQWILRARRSLQNGQPIDLTGEKPAGLFIHVADNLSPVPGVFS